MELICMAPLPLGIVEIPLEKIRLGKAQARQRDTGVDPDDDLVHSIRKNGLLQPIVVKQSPDGNYDVILGQRRFRAHEILEKPSIRACVIDGSLDELGAKRISFAENATQKKMKEADYVDVVGMFMDKYGKISIVAEELGMSTGTVRKYVKFYGLPKLVQEAVKTNKVKLAIAIRALNAHGGGEEVDPQLLLETATELQKLSRPARDKFVKIIKNEPGTAPAAASTKANARTETHKIVLEASEDQLSRIDRFREKNEIDKTEDAASELIDMGLEVAESR